MRCMCLCTNIHSYYRDIAISKCEIISKAMASASNPSFVQESASTDGRERRNQRDRARRASETAAQREERLRKRRVRDRARRAEETEDQRAARLARQRGSRNETLAADTEEQRTARLSANRSERLAMESEQQRTARLERLSANQSGRLHSSLPVPQISWLHDHVKSLLAITLNI